jgi:hypothetical protein
VPYAFCLLHLTTLVSIARFVRGAQTVRWEKLSDVVAGEAASHPVARP